MLPPYYRQQVSATALKNRCCVFEHGKYRRINGKPELSRVTSVIGVLGIDVQLGS